MEFSSGPFIAVRCDFVQQYLDPCLSHSIEGVGSDESASIIDAQLSHQPQLAGSPWELIDGLLVTLGSEMARKDEAEGAEEGQ